MCFLIFNLVPLGTFAFVFPVDPALGHPLFSHEQVM